MNKLSFPIDLNEIEILELMHNLELFVNQNDDYDSLIQMALIHF